MFYLINKESGISSFKAIKEFAKSHNIKKIGHTGTLDPLATGLLLVATDEDTKLIEYIDKGFKTYQTTLSLNQSSNTYDIEGDIKTTSTKVFDQNEVVDVIKSFEKEYWQTPPAFSARKINGKRAYELARNNEEVKLKPSLVKIKKIFDIKQIDNFSYSFTVEVSRGTYIRSLIHDIGLKLNTNAIMTQLERIAIGNLTLVTKPTPVNIKSLISLSILKLDDIKDLLYGKIVETKEQDGIYALEYKDNIVGIVEIKNQQMKSKKLLGTKIKKMIL